MEKYKKYLKDAIAKLDFFPPCDNKQNTEERLPCKRTLSSIHQCQFLGLKFGIQNFCPCKRDEKYEVCSTEVLNGGSGGGYPKSGPKLNFNGSGAS